MYSFFSLKDNELDDLVVLKGQKNNFEKLIHGVSSQKSSTCSQKMMQNPC